MTEVRKRHLGAFLRRVFTGDDARIVRDRRGASPGDLAPWARQLLVGAS
ncbi:hypothetical protein ABZX40_05230 [Streptomyces sp. NPDC004610]